MKQSRVTIVGSLNMDLVTEAPSIPTPGETVMGTRFTTSPGGKGNNQAVACSRLGAEVTFIGCVGNDIYGKQLLENLQNEQINIEHITILPDVNTGIASIMVEKGENIICVVPGANYHLTPDKIIEHEKIIKESDIILVQLEVPLETVVKTAEIATNHNVPVILNPAPGRVLPVDLLEKVTYITPNEHELSKMFGEEITDSLNSEELMRKMPEKIIMTKGAEGAYFVNHQGKLIQVPSYKVEAVDTTGAGDTFNAGLAVMLSQETNLLEATKFAVTAGALSVTKFGAQNGIPAVEEVTQFMNKHLSINE